MNINLEAYESKKVPRYYIPKPLNFQCHFIKKWHCMQYASTSPNTLHPKCTSFQSALHPNLGFFIDSKNFYWINKQINGLKFNKSVTNITFCLIMILMIALWEKMVLKTLFFVKDFIIRPEMLCRSYIFWTLCKRSEKSGFIKLNIFRTCLFIQHLIDIRNRECSFLIYSPVIYCQFNKITKSIWYGLQFPKY